MKNEKQTYTATNKNSDKLVSHEQHSNLEKKILHNLSI